MKTEIIQVFREQNSIIKWLLSFNLSL